MHSTRDDWEHPYIELVEELCSGAMGQVWRAHHHGIGADVAVKFLARELLGREDVRERFRNEARAVATIDERHVVRYHDYAQTPSGRPYIVMELLRGVTLQRMLDHHGPFAPSQVALVIEQLASALDAVHRAGVVHRDVKPENVLLVPRAGELTVKLLDFGIAVNGSHVCRLTNPGLMVGTPNYMSPEQVRGEEVEAASDVWALGVLAYELLTNALPFRGKSLESVCAAITMRRCVPPSTLLPSLSKNVDEWFAKATALDSADRYPTAGALARRFRRAIEAIEMAVEVAPHGDDVRQPPSATPESKEVDDVDTFSALTRTPSATTYQVPTLGPPPAVRVLAAALLLSGLTMLGWIHGIRPRAGDVETSVRAMARGASLTMRAERGMVAAASLVATQGVLVELEARELSRCDDPERRARARR